MPLDLTQLSQITEPLLAWYEKNARVLPWRENTDAYRVWVSEIMLQQTRVDTVIPYYERFLRRFPDVAALAAAPEQELLKMWEGLGYYSRVRNMQKAAQQICEKYNGIFPNEYEQLLSLPGIGAYTAGAVASIAWNKPYAAVDGNVLRVVTRLTADSREISDTKFKRNHSGIAGNLSCGQVRYLYPEPDGTGRSCLHAKWYTAMHRMSATKLMQCLCRGDTARVSRKEKESTAQNRRQDRTYNDTCGQAGAAKKSRERTAWWHVGTAESAGKSGYSANPKVACKAQNHGLPDSKRQTCAPHFHTYRVADGQLSYRMWTSKRGFGFYVDNRAGFGK